MTWHIFYNSDKKIVWSTTSNIDSNVITEQANEGLSYLSKDTDNAPSPDIYWVNSGGTDIEEMTTFAPLFSSKTPAIDDTVTITGLPSGTEVFVDDVSKGTMNSTSLSFSCDEPGKYKIQFSKLGYKYHSPEYINVKRYGE